MKRLLTGLAVSILLLLQVPSSARAFQEEVNPEAARTFATLADMTSRRNLSGTVSVRTFDPKLGVRSMKFRVQASQPAGLVAQISYRLADGRWAVPIGNRTSAPRSVNQSAAKSAVARARTFVAAGRDLVWASEGYTPLSGKVTKDVETKPYPVTCSHFVAMVMQGWDYNHTTYVANQNTRVGPYVNYGPLNSEANIFSANRLAAWHYAKGDMWYVAGKQDWQVGDILFYSRSGYASSGRFANVYHAALYIGDNKVIHSWGVGSGAGVVEEPVKPWMFKDVAFVARPNWTALG